MINNNFQRLSKVNWLALSLGFTFLYFPILMLIVFSFNSQRDISIWYGFSLEWYVKLFNNKGMMDAILLSFIIAVTTAFVSTFIALVGALFLLYSKANRKLKGWLAGVLTLPLAIPEVITGLALLLFFVSVNMNRGIVTIMIAHVTFCISFALVIIQSRLNEMNHSYLEAALDLGYSHIKAYLFVIIPILFPTIMSALLFTFTLSFDDVVIASFTSGPSSTTLPVKILSTLRLQLSPEINAVATLILVSITAVILLIALLQRKQLAKK